MSLFKRRRFPVEIILLCVRCTGKYAPTIAISEMMQERGVAVDHDVFRRVQRYAPEIERRIRLYQVPRSGSWRVDEIDVRVRGQVDYTCPRDDKHGRLIAFKPSERRNTNAAYRSLRKALRAASDHPPSPITTDRVASYPQGSPAPAEQGLLPKEYTLHLEISEQYP